jgi:ribosomal protein L4
LRCVYPVKAIIIQDIDARAGDFRAVADNLCLDAKAFGLANVLILVEAYDEKLDLASRNLHGVEVLPAAAVDPRSLLGHDHVLATVGAVRMLEEKLS